MCFELPNVVLSGLSGGSQNMTIVRMVRKTQGNMRMNVKNTTFLLRVTAYLMVSADVVS